MLGHRAVIHKNDIAGIDDEFYTVYGAAPEPPEKYLIAAVLAHAIRDLHTGNCIVRREAAAWVRSEEVDPFSFIWCCHVLDLHVSVMRDRALALRREWFGQHRFRG